MPLRREHKIFIISMAVLFVVAIAVLSTGNVAYSIAIFCLFFIIMMGLSYLNYKGARKLEDSQKAIIFALANLAEWRDPETGLHLERTRNYGVILAKELAKNPKYTNLINQEFIDGIYHAAPLHDIGKVGIRDAILLKEGKLSDVEYAEMKRHVIIAKNILSDIINKFGSTSKYLPMCLNIAAYHHEKYDGTGYAAGLKGEEICLEARLYTLCDAYDTIRAKRPYKKEKSHEEAISIIVSERGKHFDPDVVDAFLACHHKFMEAFEAYSMLSDVLDTKTDERSTEGMNILWTDKLLVNVAIIDQQHKELIDLINNMLNAIQLGEGAEKIAEAIDFLEVYVSKHFGEEEQLMTNSEYPEYALHTSQHIQFVQRFHILKQRFEKEGVTSELLLDLNRHLLQWLVKHIMATDKRLGEYLSGYKPSN